MTTEITEQAAVAKGVQAFVDSLATTVSETMAIAGEKVVLEAGILRQQYRFEAYRGVLGTIQSQRDQLRADYVKAADDVERELITHQLSNMAVQLSEILMQSGVSAKAAIVSANKATTLPLIPEVVDAAVTIPATPVPVPNAAGKKKVVKKKTVKKKVAKKKVAKKKSKRR